MKNLVLIGYRGTGKTEVSKVLGQRLGIEVINLDEEIVKKTGVEIPAFVEKYGWNEFRDVESKLTKKFSKLKNVIINTGGGTILKEENAKCLKKNGIIILLNTEIATIKERIKKSKDRPPLTDSKSAIDEIETVLKQREEKYNQAADYTIKTYHLSIEEVANEVIKVFKKR